MIEAVSDRVVDLARRAWFVRASSAALNGRSTSTASNAVSVRSPSTSRTSISRMPEPSPRSTTRSRKRDSGGWSGASTSSQAPSRSVSSAR